MKTAELYADSNRGVYIPQFWAQSADLNQWCDYDQDQIAILQSGPDHESYWETWESVLDNVRTIGGGQLHQDGDLWVIYPDQAIQLINEHCETCVEYETTHKDAGDNYSHMPRESWCNEELRRLIDQCKDVDFNGLDADHIADIALENFRMYRGTIYGISGDKPDSDYIILDSFHVQEVEIDLSSLGIDGVTMDVIRESCDAYISGTNMAYVATQAVWYAAILKTTFQSLINEESQS